jgi:Tfp pilus assembly protein PilF
MSLLLDALKKAEKAKDDAKRRLQGDASADADETLIHVRTRNELPDISRPMEIHSDDIPGVAQSGTSDNPVPDAFYASPSPRPVAAPPQHDANADTDFRRRPEPDPNQASAPDPQAGQRAAARNVFEAKFKEPNPKLPFYITMAVLGLFTAGTVIYFWYQLRPPPPLVNTDAKPPGNESKAEVVDSRPSPAATPTALEQAPAIQGLPQTASVGTAPVPQSATQPVPAASPAAAQKPAARSEAPAVATAPVARTSRPTARQQAVNPASQAADPSKLSVNRAAPEVNPKVEAAWRAYNQGDLQTARTNYLEALREEPSNRDALLGMAAIEVRANRPELAETYYQRLLEVNPRDPHAQAGMLALRSQMTDPVQAESRVKSLLATDPEAHVLYFTLGNQFAQQGRWPEAQQAYFKAFSADPENPDFAYNLAVSLDQVKQSKLALEYYRRAIALAQQRSSSFDQALARNRVQVLAR